MKIDRIKLNGEKLEMLHAAKLYAREGYIKVTEWSLTTSGTTGRAVYVTYQLVWSVVMRIEYANPNVIDYLTKHLR